jgi:hypothetical protein
MMHGSFDGARSWIRVFGAPIAIAAATSIGLLAALLWGDVGRYVTWVTVSWPLAVVTRAWLRRSKKV